jgi:hypothetical protein
VLDPEQTQQVIDIVRSTITTAEAAMVALRQLMNGSPPLAAPAPTPTPTPPTNGHQLSLTPPSSAAHERCCELVDRLLPDSVVHTAEVGTFWRISVAEVRAADKGSSLQEKGGRTPAHCKAAVYSVFGDRRRMYGDAGRWVEVSYTDTWITITKVADRVVKRRKAT